MLILWAQWDFLFDFSYKCNFLLCFFSQRFALKNRKRRNCSRLVPDSLSKYYIYIYIYIYIYMLSPCMLLCGYISWKLGIYFFGCDRSMLLSQSKKRFLTFYIYIYIYIYIMSSTYRSCFTLSRIISVARYVDCFWEGSKSDWFEGSLSSYPCPILPIAFCGWNF